ncbi:hypothetical protein [Streptomyces sp. NPDC092903]
MTALNSLNSDQLAKHTMASGLLGAFDAPWRAPLPGGMVATT